MFNGMPTHPILDQVLQLPPDERIRLIADAWASLTASPASVPVPDWHRDLLDDRLADASGDGSRSWDDVKRTARRSAQ